MAEERIIDDEYGRGVKLRKTEDGFVDVTDELAENETQDKEQEEISFAFPMEETEEDDEDLAGLSPEEAAALRKQKAEAAERRKAEYDKAVAEGNALLETGSFHAAELKFEKALQLDDPATLASVGYWRAKTADFTNPDVLIEEYVEPGIESLEYDLGYEAADIIKREYREVFLRRFNELAEQEKPLAERVEGKQQKRREILKDRRKNSVIAFIATAIPLLVCLILTVVFALKITTTPDGRYIPVTAVFGGISLVAFIVFAVFTNKLINTLRIYTANERLTSTEEGEELFQIREYKDLYEALLQALAEEEETQAE